MLCNRVCNEYMFFFITAQSLSGQGCPHIGYFAATALDEDYTQCVCTLALSWLLEARSRLRYQGLLNILREKVAAREVVGQRYSRGDALARQALCTE